MFRIKSRMRVISEREAAQAASRHKISASILGQIKWFKDSDMALDSFAYDLVNGTKETEAMRIGTAWHKVLENAVTTPYAHQNINRTFEANGIQFLSDIPIIIAEPLEVEKKVVRYYELDGMAIRIAAVIDAIQEDRLIEYKTTKRFQADNYYWSHQWQLYLFLMEAYGRLDYHVFKIGKSRFKMGGKQTVAIKEHDILSCYWHPSITAEIEEQTRQAIRFYKAAGIRTNDEWQLEFE